MDMSLKKYVFMVIVPSFLIALGIPLVFGYIDKNTVIAIPWYAKYFLPASLVMLSLLIPIIISVAKKAEIERYMHLFITRMCMLSTARMPPDLIFKHMSEMDEYGALRNEIKKIHILVAYWNRSISEAARFISAQTPSLQLADFLDRMAHSLEAGEDFKEFLGKERRVVEFNGLKREYEKKFLLKKYTIDVDRLERDLDKVEKAGIEMGSGRDALGLARENLAVLDFEAVRRSLSLAEKVLEAAKGGKAREEVKREFASTMKLYGLLTKTGLVLDDQKSMLEDVMTSIKNDDYLAGLSSLSELKSALLDLREGYFREKTEGYLKDVERLLRKARGSGMDVKAMSEKVKRSWALLEVNRNRDAMVIALDSRDKLKKMFEDHDRQIYERKLRSLREAIKEAEDRGIEADEERGILNAITEKGASKGTEETLKELEDAKKRLKGRLEDQRLKMYEIRMRNLASIGSSAEGTDVDHHDPGKEGSSMTMGYGERGSVTWKAEGILPPRTPGVGGEALLSRLKSIETGEDGSVDPREMVSNILRSTTGKERREMLDLAGEYVRVGQYQKAAILYEELGEENLAGEVLAMMRKEGQIADEAGGGEDEGADGDADTEEFASLLFVTPEQRSTFDGLNKGDLDVFKMMLEGNVFRRVRGGRYKIFSKGITNRLDRLVNELRSNNPDLDTEEIVEELGRMYL